VSRHRLVFHALRALLPTDWELDECLPRDAQERCAAWHPAVVLLDFALAEEPSAAGQMRELGQRLARQYSVVALLEPEPQHPEERLPAGIHGALAVNDPLEDWPLALAAAVRGAAYFSPAVASHLPAGNGNEHLGVEKALSIREKEILSLLKQCRAPREIAALLGRSVKTIEAHIQRMKAKLGLVSLAELRGDATEKFRRRLEPSR
jgi:DNA-binding NarL/FixJ family response regulator